jgi:hypothetical protein
VEDGAKLWIKRLSGVSLVLILVFVASYGHSTDNIIKKMDVDENYIIKLESGEQGSVELTEIGYYIALRIDEKGQKELPELKLIDDDGLEIEGREPGLIESKNKRPDATGDLVYVPVRVLEIKNNGDYDLTNEGNTTLWLVNDVEIQASLFSDNWILLSMISCCLGFPLGVITLIVGLILWRRGQKAPQKEIIIQENIMTTDELFKMRDSVGNVADPFVTRNDGAEEDKEEVFVDNTEGKSEGVSPTKKVSDNGWKNWDDGE